MDFKRYIHLDENDDGTMTMTMSFDKDEETIVFVMDFDFDELFNSFAPSIIAEMSDEVQEKVKQHMLHVPSSMEEF